MSAFFLKLFNMSITASWLVLAVVLLRLLLKRAPKAICCALWILVGLRLVFPFSVESVLSLIPSAETVPQDIVYSSSPAIHSGITAINHAVNPIISASFAPDVTQSVSPMQTITSVASYIWAAGVAVMLIYSITSYLLLRRKTREAVPLEKGIFLCDRIDSPFILGLIKPRIYLPSEIDKSDAEFVIAHERAHLRRRDHLWKPLGFALLGVYWFNPVIWVAYILLCRDIELACDEKVIRQMGTEVKKPYSEALINCSLPRHRISACPLAFGEVGVEKRIKSVLSYKKPAFWIIIFAVIISIAAAVCLLTDPKEKHVFENQSAHSDIMGIAVRIVDIEISDPSPYIEIEWKNNGTNDIVYGEPFYIYKNENGAWTDCNRMSDVFNLPGYYLSPGVSATKKYSLNSMQMDEPGLYRFESHYSIEGSPEEKHTVSVEFELTEPVEGIDIRQVIAISAVAAPMNGDMFSFVPSMPMFRIVNEKHLFSWQEERWTACGDIKAENLTEKIWDDELNGVRWNDDHSAASLRSGNNRSWLIDSGESEGSHFFYLILEQKDGKYYIAQGNYSHTSGYRIIYVYLVEEVTPEDPVPSGAIISVVYDTPPSLLLTANGQSIIAWEGSYSWSYIDEKGESRTKSNSSSDPFGNIEIIKPWCINMLSYDGPGEPVVTLSFALEPDTLTVSCIDISARDPKPQSVTVDGMGFELKNGEYIYKINAEWSSFANNYGSVEYAFFTGMTGYGEKEWHDGFRHDLVYDIDNDSINEYVVIASGGTTDFFTFTVGACDEGKLTGDMNSTYFMPESPMEISLTDNGATPRISVKNGEGVERVYNIGVDEVSGRITLYCEETNEYMPYWDAMPYTPIIDEVSMYPYNPIIDTIVGDINGDGIEEKCMLSACPELETFSFVFSVIEIGSSNSVYDYLTVFQCEGADEAIFTEMNGRIYIQTHNPGHPNFLYDDSYILWEIDFDENGKLRLSFDGGKQVMTSYNENELVFNENGDIVYVGNSDVPSSLYNPIIDTIVGDINGDGYDESCTLSVGPTYGVSSFCLSVNTLISSSNGYKAVFRFMDNADLSFVEKDGRIYVRGIIDETGEEADYLIGIDIEKETIILTREGTGEVVYYGSRVLLSDIQY